MTRLVTLLLLGLSACASRDLSPYVQEETEETVALRAYAAAAWQGVGVRTPNDYALGLLPDDELQVACEVPEGKHVAACTFQEERVILLYEGRAAEALLHELGHLTRADGAHPQCDRHGRGPDVMCPGEHPGPFVGPTARDAAFVRGR